MPDYVFSHLIRKFRELAPKESLGVLYGKIIEENGETKAKAKKVWIPSSQYLETTSTGVKLTEMGKKYHSYIDHFEILSDSSAVAWVHSHPIDTLSSTDKATQKIAQLFDVPYGVYVNYSKLSTPRKAIKAFKIEDEQQVVRIPIKIISTETCPSSQEIERRPKFSAHRAHTKNLLSALQKYLDSLLKIFKGTTETNIKSSEAMYRRFDQMKKENRNDHENLFHLLKVAQKNAKNKVQTMESEIADIQKTLEQFKTARQGIEKKAANLARKVEKLRTNVEENRKSIETLLEEVKVLPNKFEESSQKVISEIKALQKNRKKQEKTMKELRKRLK